MTEKIINHVNSFIPITDILNSHTLDTHTLENNTLPIRPLIHQSFVSYKAHNIIIPVIVLEQKSLIKKRNQNTSRVFQVAA